MPDVGDLATASLTVDPFDGTTDATLLVTRPDSTTANPSVTSSGGGETWTATVTYNQPGWWLLAWTVTGTGAGKEYQQVHVAGAPAAPSTTPLICSIEQLKKWLRYGSDRDIDNDLLLLALTSATEWVEWRLSGPITVREFSERIWANGPFLRQRRHPLVDVVSVTPQDAGVLNSSSYIVDTTNSWIQLRFNGYGWYDVTYEAGHAQLRAGARQAGQEVARHLWTVLNGSAGRGRNSEELVPTQFGFAVPRRAEELISADPNNELMPGFA